MTATTSPLDYAPLPRGVRRRRWVRRVAWLLLLIALTFAALYRKEIGGHAGLLYAQQRAMNHSLPADLVVFARDPDQAKALVGSSRGYVWSTANSPPAVRPDPVWDDFQRRITNSGFAQGGRPGATVFCHAMRTPAGKRRLVALNLFYRGPWSNVPILFEATVVDPATLVSKPPKVSISLCDISYRSMMMAMQRTQIFAGQIDPDDPSHFTIAYQIGDEPGIMDARLRDNDTLLVTVRSGPATRVLAEDQSRDPR